MPNERLLKRIRHWGKGQGERVSGLDIGDYKKSVLSDIELLYNTKKGTVLIADEIGVPDFTSLLNSFGQQEVSIIEEAFKVVTDKYEPRMRNTEVKFLPRENEYGILRFIVTGSLMFRNQEVPVEFNALVQSNGSVSIDA